MHFRVLKIIPTSGFLTAVECTKFVLPLGELTALCQTASWFKGDPTFKGKGRGGDRREKVVGHGSPNANSCIRPWYRLQVDALNSGKAEQTSNGTPPPRIKGTCNRMTSL